MLGIACIAGEYALGVSAWDLKAKWNECLFMSRFWEFGESEVQQIPWSQYDRWDQEDLRDWVRRRREMKQKYQHLMWHPWELIAMTWGEVKWRSRDGLPSSWKFVDVKINGVSSRRLSDH
jgi:hypothetical protein